MQGKDEIVRKINIRDILLEKELKLKSVAQSNLIAYESDEFTLWIL